jgi:hypothetical protein
MASLSIPEPIQIGLTKIAILSDESFQELISALEHIPLKIRQHRIFDDWPLNLQTLSEQDAKNIRDALIPLYIGLVSGKAQLSTYVDDITDSLRQGRSGDEWAQSDEVTQGLKERLTQLLSIDSLQLVAKAHDVLLEHAQTFASARIISDIRPVFRDTVEETPRAAVIVHMLNLAYRDPAGRQEFVVALDTKDIQDLMDVLERAKKKTESLSRMMASTNMTYIEVV